MSVPWARNAAQDEVGERLKECRLALGLSLRELALIVGVTNAYLSRVENGKRAPSLSLLLLLASALGTTVLFLATGEMGTCPYCGRVK